MKTSYTTMLNLNLRCALKLISKMIRYFETLELTVTFYIEVHKLFVTYHTGRT